MAEDGTLIPAQEHTPPLVDDTTKPETTDTTGDNKKDDLDKTDIPTDDTPTDTDPIQIWPFVVCGVALAAIIIVIVAIRKHKKVIPADEGIAEESDDNGGSDE